MSEPEDVSDIQAVAGWHAGNQAWAREAAAAVEFLTVVDSSFRVVFVNHAQPGLDNPVGMLCTEFIPVDQRPQFRRALVGALETGLPHHFETEGVGPDGATSYYSGWTHRMTRTDGSRHVAIVGTDVTHLRRVEERLAVTDETLRALVTSAPDIIGIVGRSHCIEFINREGVGAEGESIVGSTIESLLPMQERQHAHEAIEQAFLTGEVQSFEMTMGRFSEEGQPERRYATRVSAIQGGGEVSSVTVISTDITDRVMAEKALRASEEQLRQSQKLQAIGQLTGGIAHDFNNLLMVVSGSLDEIEYDIAHPGAVKECLRDARAAVERAAFLTQRLLAFGRRQSLSPSALDVAELLNSVTGLLRRTLGQRIDIVVETTAGLWLCEADRGQLENALLNLAINARDAMAESGGRLLLGASNVTIGEMSNCPPEMLPGDYVCITVKDSGPGFEPEAISRAFEPFFTTKEAGTGGGLGLSMVYGFAQQSGGHATLASEEGQGALVSLFLPRARQLRHGAGAGNRAAARAVNIEPGETAGEHVLVVEDQEAVAQLAERMLNRLGYRTTVVGDAQRACECLDAGADVQLVMSDIGLPGAMSGVDLANKIADEQPDLPVLLVTGYDRGLLGARPGRAVLRKPYSLRRLADIVSELLSN